MRTPAERTAEIAARRARAAVTRFPWLREMLIAAADSLEAQGGGMTSDDQPDLDESLNWEPRSDSQRLSMLELCAQQALHFASKLDGDCAELLYAARRLKAQVDLAVTRRCAR